MNAASCDIEAVKKPEYIAEFATALVEKINMVAFGDPIVVHFADHDEYKAGYTLIQLIETSNINAHFVDINGDCYLDVFSCMWFDMDDVLAILSQYFNPKSVNYNFLTRQA